MQHPSYHTNADFRLLSFLLAFIFSGAIVGETTAISIVVSAFGSQVLGKLYLVNGLLLFSLPVLLFKYIDLVKREKLLSIQLAMTAFLLMAYWIGTFFFQDASAPFFKAVFAVIYPLSYLSKTILFITFWTLANDFCYPAEAKRIFPVIAAWGLGGGAVGAWIARILLSMFDVSLIIGFWAVLYGVAWAILQKVGRKYRHRLTRPEKALKSKVRLGQLVRDVFDIKLVRSIAAIYLLAFLTVFLTDFLFWQQCHRWFQTSQKLASFQFSFYLLHALTTVICLHFILPGLIPRLGFTNILFGLPGVLFSGAVLILASLWGGMDMKTMFAAFILIQFLRNVAFENAFSPVYQMFFVAISEQKRGRAKMCLDGIVKPFAIVVSGLLLIIIGENQALVLALIVLFSGVMLYLVSKIGKKYIDELFTYYHAGPKPGLTPGKTGSYDSQKIVSFIEECVGARDSDVRILAVKFCAERGTRDDFERLKTLYSQETVVEVKEEIARSLSPFYWIDTKKFIEELLQDDTIKIRANAVHSLNEMNCHWKWQLSDRIRSMLFENNLLVPVEAARFLWQGGNKGEREHVRSFCENLLESKNAGRCGAGLQLAGLLQFDGWEQPVLRHLGSDSEQVFAKAAEVLFSGATEQTRMQALYTISDMSREHIRIAGAVMLRTGVAIVPTLVSFVRHGRSRRMLFEIIHALRKIKYLPENQERPIDIDMDTGRFVRAWILGELGDVYRDVWEWNRYIQSIGRITDYSSLPLLEDALKERMFRVAGWALDTMVLLDREGLVTWGRRDLDLQEYSQRCDMVEILESMGSDPIVHSVVPLLRIGEWDELAKTAKNLYRERCDDREEPSLRFFTGSENKWICLCAFYCLVQTQRYQKLIAQDSELLHRFSTDPSIYLSTAASYLLEMRNSKGKIEVYTFGLLETVLFLKKTTIFAAIPAEKLMALAEICTGESFPQNTVISSEGDLSNQLYLVKSGALAVRKSGMVIAEIPVGEMYGEVGLFKQAPRYATAVAKEDCELYIIQRSALKKLIVSNPDIAYCLLEAVSEKLRRTGEEVTSVTVELNEMKHRTPVKSTA